VAGDMLLEVLQRHADELDVVFDHGIRYGEPAGGRSGRPDGDVENAEGSFSFDHYPTSGRLKAELARPEMHAELDMVRRKAATREDQLVYDVMNTGAGVDGLNAPLESIIAEAIVQLNDQTKQTALI